MGSMLCPGCRKLISVDEERCPYCGMARPGLFGLAPRLQRLFGARLDLVWGISVVCMVLYAISLAVDVRGIGMQGLMFLSPSRPALVMLGMTGKIPVQWGSWWTILTAIYLHGGLLHIFFNVMWIRQLGTLADMELGTARFFILFTLTGAAGYILSALMGSYFTLGASGSICGLLGAMIAFRRRRGASGDQITQQFVRLAVILAIFSFLPGVDKWAHAGGFVLGYLFGQRFPGIHERPETRGEQLLALGLVLMTLVGFGLSIVRGLPLFLHAVQTRGL